MTRILFICLGNICRSVMAEMVMKDMVRAEGREKDFYIDSAATCTEELGNDIYPPAKECLRKHGVKFEPHRARQAKRSDYNDFDIILCAEQSNITNLRGNFGADVVKADAALPKPKIIRMMTLLDSPDHLDVADPWYTGNFESTYNDVAKVCRKLLEIY